MPAPKTISVGQFRQKPAQVIRDVRAGAIYVLTDQGLPVADIAPHRDFHGVPSEEVARLLAELVGPDPAFAHDVEAFRESFELRDPWEHPK
jgi:antitoxin (DNA-binding transcriptional repressor) of toxin-antitoxin stability system